MAINCADEFVMRRETLLWEPYREETVQFLRSSARPWAARLMTLRRKPALAWARTAAFVAIALLLNGAVQLYAQGRTSTASLVLQVRPEVLLEDQNGSVGLKIRLARGATASLWAANSCTSPSAPSHVIISMSGFYSLPLSALIPASANPNPSTTQVCLASSDGALNESLTVEVMGTGNGAAVPGATSLIAPIGVVVATQAGTTTWSKP